MGITCHESHNRKLKSLKSRKIKEVTVNENKKKKLERETIERERIDRERIDRERIERERIERERIERERIERERIEKERIEKERIERERIERERIERERIERERIEKERIERERIVKKNKSKDENCIVPDEINIKINDKISPHKIDINDKEKLLNLREKVLKKHNEFRKKHGVGNLKLNADLCELAQLSAEKYSETVIENICMIPPKLYKDDIVGENIAIIDNNNSINMEDIVNKWYEEKQNYVFDSNKYIENTGHFTQLIWKKTEEIGFGYKKSNNGKVYFIAIYYPAGNIFNQFNTNVLKEQNDE